MTINSQQTLSEEKKNNLNLINSLNSIENFLNIFDFQNNSDPFIYATYETVLENLYSKNFVIEKLFSQNCDKENFGTKYIAVFNKKNEVIFSNGKFNELQNGVNHQGEINILWETLLSESGDFIIKIGTLDSGKNSFEQIDEKINIQKNTDFGLQNTFNMFLLGLIKLLNNNEIIINYLNNERIQKFKYIIDNKGGEKDLMEFIRNSGNSILIKYIKQKIEIINQIKPKLNPNGKGIELVLEIEILGKNYFANQNNNDLKTLYLTKINDFINYLKISNEGEKFLSVINEIEKEENSIILNILREDKYNLLDNYLQILLSISLNRDDFLRIKNLPSYEHKNIEAFNNFIELIKKKFFNIEIANKIIEFLKTRGYPQDIIGKVYGIISKRIIKNDNLFQLLKSETVIDFIKKIQYIEQISQIGDLIVNQGSMMIYFEKGGFFNNKLAQITSFTNQEINSMLNDGTLGTKMFGDSYNGLFELNSQEKEIHDDFFEDTKEKSTEKDSKVKNELEIRTKFGGIGKVFLNPYIYEYKGKINKILIGSLISDITESNLDNINSDETQRFFEKQLSSMGLGNGGFSELREEDLDDFMKD